MSSAAPSLGGDSAAASEKYASTPDHHHQHQPPPHREASPPSHHQLPVSTSPAQPSSSTASAASASASAPTSASASAASAKPRSCVVCRSRKVRCDKLSPCSNCRRANIDCVRQPNDRPPRWARRLVRQNDAPASVPVTAQPSQGPGALTPPPPAGAHHVDPQLLERLRSLESLVKSLSGQIEQVNRAAPGGLHGPHGVRDSVSVDGGSLAAHQRCQDTFPVASSSESAAYLKDSTRQPNRTSHFGNRFWSRMSHELEELKIDALQQIGDDSATSDDEDALDYMPPSDVGRQLDRRPADRHAFLFSHCIGAPSASTREYAPLPSQVPFLLNVYAENVNIVCNMMHMPTLNRMMREHARNQDSQLTLANEALLASIYYAAVSSMEGDDVAGNFGCSKTELLLKFRLGVEHSLARADFLENPDLVLVQAFAIFLILARRHDSPRFVWMMVGLLVRMAQSIGLQRDGTHFTHLTPFEVEMRRRAWYNVLALDQRSSDDMGTTFSISRGSYDTRLPTNLRDSDLNPDTKELPRGREEVCEVTASISSWAINEVIRDVMAASDIQEQDRLLNEIWKVFEHRYLRYMTDTTSWFYWYIHHCNRLVIAKNTLFVYLPALLNDLNTEIKEQSRDKMLVCAIEVAEYNHYLNAEERVRGLRWLTQSFTQWHAIVYLLLEIVRRPWSPIVERAWVALHSSWLIPSRSTMTKNERIWATLRKLMARARKHRRQELHALCADPMSVDKRELDEAGRFVLGSSGPFPRERAEELFTAHWRSLFEPSGPTTLQHGGEGRTLESSMYCPYNSSKGTPSSTSDASRARAQSGAAQVMDHAESQPRLHVDEIARASGDAQSAGLSAPSFAGVDLHSMATNFSASSTLAGPGAQVAPPYMAQPAISADWSGGQPIGPGFSAWLWADSDPESDTYGFSTDSLGMDMDLDETAMDWNGWLDEARGMYW